ncbi:MAG TPA: hypothetical protein VF683_11295 [Chthoniobacterales bacterium]
MTMALGALATLTIFLGHTTVLGACVVGGAGFAALVAWAARG